jgi:predicted  nucleic acid-binding Zn-ribbon protein
MSLTELLLAQRSQAESDYALAVALSEGQATSERLNDDESKLIAAATQESLKLYHGQNGTVAVDNVDKRSQIDVDREVALAFQKEQEQIDHESEQLARQLQEMEYAQRQQPAPNRVNRPARTKNSAPSSGSNAAASGNCTVS